MDNEELAKAFYRLIQSEKVSHFLLCDIMCHTHIHKKLVQPFFTLIDTLQFFFSFYLLLSMLSFFFACTEIE